VLSSYYNGGGVFVDAPKFTNQGVEILADYNDKLDVDAGEGRAAMVCCKVGDGAALLTGPHPEFVFGFSKPADNWSLTKPRFASQNLQHPKEDVPGFEKVRDDLAKDEKHRMDFLKACLVKLGLTVSEEQNVPSLSIIHFSAMQPSKANQVLQGLKEVITEDVHGNATIKDENDTFYVVQPSTFDTKDLRQALSENQSTATTTGAPADQSSDSPSQASIQSSSNTSADQIVDYTAIPKTLVVHDSDYPGAKSTPYFNHHSFYANLKQYIAQYNLTDSSTFAHHLLYGEVVETVPD